VGGRRAGLALAARALAIATTWALADGVDSIWLFRGGLFAHSVAAALLIGLCVQFPQASVARGLAWRPLQWLGLISYSLYLWHWPVIVLLSPQLTGLGPWPWTALVCAVSIAVATLSKHLVEDPIRYRAPWARGRAGSLAFATLMAGLAALWLTLPAPTPTRIDLRKLGGSADQRAAPQLPRLRGRLGEADPHLHPPRAAALDIDPERRAGELIDAERGHVLDRQRHQDLDHARFGRHHHLGRPDPGDLGVQPRAAGAGQQQRHRFGDRAEALGQP
jgi:hypothetical protein